MHHSDEQLLKHIFDEIQFLEKEVKVLSINEFLEDQKSQRAFARSIEIIGEAVKNLSEEFIIRHSIIEWRKIAGMRDKLIHGYFSVNYNLVWDVASNVIPKFKQQLQNITDDAI
jgi:uncharacterized protein with HEPN domain